MSVFNRRKMGTKMTGNFYKTGLKVIVPLLLLLCLGASTPSYGAYSNNQLAWSKVDDFQGLSGNINGQNGWSTNGDVSVANDPADSGNKVLAVLGAENRAYKALPSTISNSSTGTLFFRMRRSGNADVFGGLSDESSPSEFGAFETQAGAQNSQPGDIVVRNGSGFASKDNGFSNNTWYCVWVVANNSSNNYSVFAEGGQYGSRTQISAGGSSTFSFRNGTSDSLKTFFARSGVDGGSFYFDDIHVDGGSNNASRPVSECEPSTQPEPEPPAGWQQVDRFDSLSNGNINNQNGWSSNGDVSVANDPADSGNKVLAVLGAENRAYKALPSTISNSSTGTLFFRMRRSGNADVFGGLSDETSPSQFGSFETQAGAQNSQPGDIVVRNGSGFASKDNGFSDNTWYCVWVVANNSSDNYSVFAEGGQYGSRTQISAGGSSTFSFRNGTSDSLKTFFARSGVDGGSFYFDDIHVDVSSNNASRPISDCGPSSPPEPEPTVGWQQVDRFDNLNNGNINNQNGWSTNGDVSVANDPADSGNKVLAVLGEENRAYKALPSTISNSSTGTLFFRMRRSGNADVFGGLSDETSPSQFGSFETQTGAQNSQAGDFVVRNGSGFASNDNGFSNNTWYCVWVVANNSSDNYSVFAEGGQYGSRTQISAGGSSTFSFRNGTSDSLKTFFARSGVDGGSFYFDDIHVDVSSNNASRPISDCGPSSPPEPEPTVGWQQVDRFDNLNNGNINNQNGWRASDGISVTSDPANGGEKVLQVSGSNKYASKAFAEAFNLQQSSTLFFRMKRSGNVDAFAGASDVSQPTQFDDYEIQFGAQASTPGVFRLRDGNQFVSSSTFHDNTWYCVWLVVDHLDNAYQPYISGGQFDYIDNSPAALTYLPDFRNEFKNPLETFFARTGADGGSLYIDDIFIDAGAYNVSRPISGCQKSINPQPTGWQTIDNFESLSLGNLSNRNGWQSDSGATIVNDPESGAQKVLKIEGSNTGAYKPLAQSLGFYDGDLLFFRMRRSGAIDAFSGLAGSSNPDNFDDFEVQFGSQTAHANDFVARDFHEFSNIENSFNDNTWYCVWLLADSRNLQYWATVQGGQFENPTYLPNPDEEFSGNFAYRHQSEDRNSPASFWALSGVNSGILYLDDIYLYSDYSWSPDRVRNPANPGVDCPAESNPEPEPTPPPTIGWQSVESFDGLNRGVINNQNGWTSSDTATVVYSPSSASDQVLQLTGKDKSASKLLPDSISNSDTGTLFFRMRRSDNADAFSGLSDVANPLNFSDFETQFGGQSAHPSDFRVRHGDSFKGDGSDFQNNTWYCVWIVANNSNDTYAVSLKGGQYDFLHSFSADNNSTFNFRNGTSSPLKTFYARSGLDEGLLYIDDIYIDATTSNLDQPSGSGDCPRVTEEQPYRQWDDVENFNNIPTGPIHNQNGWTASSNVKVTTDPADANENVLQISGAEQYAHKAFPNPLGESNRSTLFFRMKRSGDVDAFAGASDVSQPRQFSDYEMQFGAQAANPEEFRVRNGDSFSTPNLSKFYNDTWYCVWIIANPHLNSYEVELSGGQYASTIALFEDAGFRNNSDDPLQTFFARSGVAGGSLYIDDIYIDHQNHNYGQPVDGCPHTINRTADEWDVVDNFETLSTGSLDNRNGWKSNGNTEIVVDPANSGRKVLKVEGSNTSAYKALPDPVAEYTSDILFFRMRRDGPVDIFGGLADSTNPSGFDDYEVQFGGQPQHPNDFVGRDSDTFSNLSDTFHENTWYCVWLRVDHARNSFSVTARGGQFSYNYDLLNPANSEGVFYFRDKLSSNNPLSTFLIQSGLNSGILYLDDIYLNQGSPIDLENYQLDNPGGYCPESQVTDPTESGQWKMVDDFNSLNNGPLGDQNGWDSTEKVVVKTRSALENDKYISLTGNNQFASKNFTNQIPNNSTGTIFFKIRKFDEPDAFIGASAKNDPSSFDDFELQVGSQPWHPGDFRVRDQSTFFSYSETFSDEKQYCVWLVADTSSDSYEVYIRGGIFGDYYQSTDQPTNKFQKIVNGNGDNPNFRNGGSDPLRSFFARTGINGSEINIDDIFIDPSGENLTIPNDTTDTCSPIYRDYPEYYHFTTWNLKDNFNNYNDGSLNNQYRWIAKQGADVVEDPQDQENQVIRLTGESAEAFQMSELVPQWDDYSRSPESNGFFFRMKRSGQINAFIGFTDDDQPSNETDYEVQIGAQPEDSEDFRIRSQDEFLTAQNSFKDDTWYCVYVWVDNGTNQYQIFLDGGQFGSDITGEKTPLYASGQNSFGFRNGGANDLDNLYLRTGPGHQGALYIDDLYTNPRSLNEDGGEYNNLPPAVVNKLCPRSTEDNPDKNEPPVVRDDSIEILRNSTGTYIDVLGNDSDPDGEVLILNTTLVEQPNFGWISITGNQPGYGNDPVAPRRISYSPHPNFLGTDTFVYEACDIGTPNLCNQATVTVTVKQAETTCHKLTLAHTGSGWPLAIRNYLREGSPGCSLGHYVAGETIYLFAYPHRGSQIGSWEGTLEGASPTWRNTAIMPNSDHTVTVHYVEAELTNHDPKTNPDSFVFEKNSWDNQLDVLSNDYSWPDRDETLSIFDTPRTTVEGGTLHNFGNVVLYTPPTNFTGQDSFVYTISDGNGGSADGEVSITVVPSQPEVRYIDLNISLYHTPDRFDRSQYERVIHYFSEAVFEMTNGVHRVRNVSFYQNGDAYEWADIRWNPQDWPRATVSGVQQSHQAIVMADIFEFAEPVNILSSEKNGKDAGYVLASLFGHYYYGLYEEFETQDGDEPTPKSIMTNPWIGAGGDLAYANFSVAKHNYVEGRLRKTAQNRAYKASGWETLSRPPTDDPNYTSQTILRPYYPELAPFAPMNNEEASIEIATPLATAEARRNLNIEWVSSDSNLLRTRATPYTAQIAVEPGLLVEYPEPVMITAQLLGDIPITSAKVSAIALAPNGSETDLILLDDGVSPDKLAGDGTYTGYLTYSQNGYHELRVKFSNQDNAAKFTSLGSVSTQAQNGGNYIHRSGLVGSDFEATATTIVRIDDVSADDHQDDTANATRLPLSNQEMAGQIDTADDVDLFRVDVTQSGEFAIRVTDLAQGMDANIRILAADGQTVISEGTQFGSDPGYFFRLISATAGDRFYIEISHLDRAAATGTYAISAGAPRASELDAPTTGRSTLYLPLLRR